ncbi:putative peptide chain release factor class I [Helianthus annuus]|nr:putative peptide chain release factor class I [Helianthus annuus]
MGEVGIKPATIEVDGRYAFGYLSGEKGTHQISSFFGIEVMGLISEDSLNVEIPDEDLQLGFSRACGSGGQNVNKVESVVRITRIPTGVTVRCTGTTFSLHLIFFLCYILKLDPIYSFR